MIKSQTIDAVINQVTNSPSSIFTKEDVLKLIEGMDYGIEREKELLVEEVKPLSLTEEQIKGLTEAIEQEIETSIQRMNTEDIVDFDTAEFSLEYNNTLRLDDIEINTDKIVDQVLKNIDKKIIGYLDYIALPVKTVVVEE
jgi:uncharacterized protein (DUF2164 family)